MTESAAKKRELTPELLRVSAKALIDELSTEDEMGAWLTRESIYSLSQTLTDMAQQLRNLNNLLDTDYPRDFFYELINKNSPYAFYIFQWVPYQTQAQRWRLKMCHDVRTFDGREECGIWPNGNHCGSFKDEEVEFIRISVDQHGYKWEDPRTTAEPEDAT